MQHALKLYPTEKENKDFGEWLSNMPEKIYQMFVRQGIPPYVTPFIKRSNKEKE